MTRTPLPTPTAPDLPPLPPEHLISIGALLAAVGLLMIRFARPRTTPDPRPRTRQPGRTRPGLRWPLVTTTAIGGAITAAQWTVITPTGPAAVAAIALGVPGLLAGATVTRLALLARLRRRGRGGRR